LYEAADPGETHVTEAKIDPGVCGFTTTVEAQMRGNECSLTIVSDCAAIHELAEHLQRVDPLQEISFRRSVPRVLQASMEHCPHAACPVPVGIIKAVEVEAKLALPADVRITLSKRDEWSHG
jgi:hypothetical protein